jgi:hypothetical protein
MPLGDCCSVDPLHIRAGDTLRETTVPSEGRLVLPWLRLEAPDAEPTYLAAV